MKKISCIQLKVSCLLQSSGIYLDLNILSQWFYSCFCKAASKITEKTNITIVWISRIKRKCLNKVFKSLTANCKQNFIKLYFWKLFNAIKEESWRAHFATNLMLQFIILICFRLSKQMIQISAVHNCCCCGCWLRLLMIFPLRFSLSLRNTNHFLLIFSGFPDF